MHCISHPVSACNILTSSTWLFNVLNSGTSTCCVTHGIRYAPPVAFRTLLFGPQHVQVQSPHWETNSVASPQGPVHSPPTPQGWTVPTPPQGLVHALPTRKHSVDSPHRLDHALPTRMHSVDSPQGLVNALAARPDPYSYRKYAVCQHSYAALAIICCNMTKQEVNSISSWNRGGCVFATTP